MQAALGLGITVVLLLATSIGLAVYGFSNGDKYSAEREENATLRATIRDMESDVVDLKQQLANLEEMEQSVRMVFGFPEIDAEERQLGTGGATAVGSGLLADPDAEAFSLETELDRLLRRCDFERANYGEVLTGLIDRREQLDHTPAISPTHGYFSRGFGVKTNPFTGRDRLHRGIDLAGYVGMPIYAPADGVVARRASQKELGRMLVINHGHGIETVYGHLSKYVAKVNERVKRGDIIAYMGNSGNSTGPHLHYEVHVNGRAVNPMKYIFDDAPSQAQPQPLAETN